MRSYICIYSLIYSKTFAEYLGPREDVVWKKMTCAVRSYVPLYCVDGCACDEVRMWVRKLRTKLRSRRRAKYFFIAIVDYRCHGIPIGVEIGQPTSSPPQTAQKSNTIFWSGRMATSLSRYISIWLKNNDFVAGGSGGCWIVVSADMTIYVIVVIHHTDQTQLEYLSLHFFNERT